MRIELDLYSPAELDAFAAFCTACATARRAEPSEKDNLLTGFGGIAGVEGWKHRQFDVNGEVDTSNQVIAAHLAEQITGENSHEEVTTSAPKRERGQPSPGKARRTKAEIAEDEAADAYDGTLAEQAVKSEQPLISTDPENRVGPEDTPEDAAQDAADEAAETAAQRGDDPALTVEDLRNVLGLYVKAYGMANAQVDLPVVLQEVCGEGVVKATDVPEDKIADAIAAIKKTGKENRFGRELAPQVTE